jgi:galactokinase
MDTGQLINLFLARYDQYPQLFRAPGTLRFMGEHAFGNGASLVLPLSLQVSVAAGKRTDGLINLYSLQFKEGVELRLSNLHTDSFHWSSKILHVLEQLLSSGYSCPGFNLLIDSELPMHAGLGSGEALETATRMALEEVLDNPGAAVFTSGYNCASYNGRKGYALHIDPHEQKFDYIPFEHKGYQLLLLDSQVENRLALACTRSARPPASKYCAPCNNSIPAFTASAI